LIGHYGTGKTTLALNYALRWAKEKKSVSLIDIDVNNPYFRSRDWRDKLEQQGIKLIIPDQEVAYGEFPFLPKHIYSVLQNNQGMVIIDVGGYDTGTVVLGSIAEKISHVPYDLWMVINTFRPEMETKEEIISLFDRLQRVSKLNITALVNNTHLADMTQMKDLRESEDVVLQAAEEIKVPFIGTAVEDKLVYPAKKHLKGPILPIQRFRIL